MNHRESSMDKIASSPQFKPFMKVVAIVGVAGAVVGFLMKRMGMEGGETLLTMGIGTLAVVAFLLGRLFPCPDENGRSLWKFAMTLTGYSLAVTIVGLGFLLMQWPGGMMMLTVGVATLALCALVWMYVRNFRNKNKDQQDPFPPSN
ncbi:MAG: hypothetical protein K6E93_10125 [Bacteroidales bacterium]|nr:hypothetical protein [Bacteroidales bacterium]